MAEVAIETERLLLRDWDASDEADFYAIMNTPAVMRHLGWWYSAVVHRLRRSVRS